MRFVRPSSVLVALSALVGALPAAGQTTQGDARPGWIGVSVDVLTTGDEHGERSEATITDVGAGSPAAEAGVRVGDRLLSVNGIPARANLLRLSHTLRPGDPVRMALVRDGRRFEVVVRAAPRPVSVATPPTVVWAMSSDSVVDAMFQAMDSLRARLASGVGGPVRVVDVAGARDSIVAVLAGGGTRRLLVRTEGSATPIGDSTTAPPARGFWRAVPDAGAVLFPDVHPPFDFYVLSGSIPDTLRRAMEDLNRTMRATRALEQARLSQLAVQADARTIAQDEELERLDRAMTEYEERSANLRAAMRHAASRAEVAAQAQAIGEEGQVSAAPDTIRFRPLTPYRLGQNWVAGAQMVDLKPELGAYFQVEAGVLVVEVPEGTPAAAAGLQPGDVIVRAGSVAVRSIADLRTGLNEPGDTLRLRLVRKGQTVRAVLGR